MGTERQTGRDRKLVYSEGLFTSHKLGNILRTIMTAVYLGQLHLQDPSCSAKRNGLLSFLIIRSPLRLAHPPSYGVLKLHWMELSHDNAQRSSFKVSWTSVKVDAVFNLK